MNARQNKKPPLTAVAAYENANLVAQDLLERVRELILDLPAPDEGAIHWGHVGSLNEVNSQLSEIVAFLGGNDE